LGAPTVDQEAAERRLLAIIAKYPDSPLPLHALLSIRADGARLESSLDLARKLSLMSPDYPPYAHLLGHYEWRCGHPAKAVTAFQHASSGFSHWMKENKATLADCPEWVKSECYRSVALASKGDFVAASTVAHDLASATIPKNRNSSPGVRLLLWDGKTLPARLLLRRGQPGDAAEALASLPKPDEMKESHGKSLAFWWIDGLRMALETQRLFDEQNFTEAQNVLIAMSQHGETLSKTQATAAAIGEKSYLNRSFRALEILASELRGKLAMQAPKGRRGVAYNWFSAALDRQRPTLMMFPPLILTPMGIHLGDYYLASDRPVDAVDAYLEALQAFPNERSALLGLKKAYESANQPAEAAATESKIQELSSQ
jgi:tetratricopeptide (TPR) repeat protein